MLEELKKFRENCYYNPEDIAEKMIQLSNLESNQEIEGLQAELENALYQIKAIAQNEYNADYYRVFYNTLLVIAGMEYF